MMKNTAIGKAAAAIMLVTIAVVLSAEVETNSPRAKVEFSMLERWKGRFQLYRGPLGGAETTFRIDTSTGEVWHLFSFSGSTNAVLAWVPISETTPEVAKTIQDILAEKRADERLGRIRQRE